MKVIAITGHSGAGKTTAAHLIHKEVGSSALLSTGDILRQTIAISSVPTNFARAQALNSQITQAMRNKVLFEYFNQLRETVEYIIVDSIRTAGDFAFLASLTEDLTLIGILCRRELRFQRIMSRQRVGDPSFYREFLKLESLETKWGVSALLKNCRASVINSAALCKLPSSIHRVLCSLNKLP